MVTLKPVMSDTASDQSGITGSCPDGVGQSPPQLEPKVTTRAVLRELYEGDTIRAQRFRYGLLVFDVLTVLFVIVTSFMSRAPWLEVIDGILGVVLLGEFIARLVASPQPWRDLVQPVTLADAAAIVSFLAPVAGEGVGFLRVLRMVRLLHAYRLLEQLRADFPFFCTNEEVFVATTHLLVFIFIMTGIVYETQHYSNIQIRNYADALYFTITALTTTGFGDITLAGTTGRLISVAIMICGVTLFLRLAQALFRPVKVRFECPHCGLLRHDLDAVHCKACGQLLKIPNDDVA
jgi:voltage-gated potassium channel